MTQVPSILACWDHFAFQMLSLAVRTGMYLPGGTMPSFRDIASEDSWLRLHCDQQAFKIGGRYIVRGTRRRKSRPDWSSRGRAQRLPSTSNSGINSLVGTLATNGDPVKPCSKTALVRSFLDAMTDHHDDTMPGPRPSVHALEAVLVERMRGPSTPSGSKCSWSPTASPLPRSHRRSTDEGVNSTESWPDLQKARGLPLHLYSTRPLQIITSSNLLISNSTLDISCNRVCPIWEDLPSTLSSFPVHYLLHQKYLALGDGCCLPSLPALQYTARTSSGDRCMLASSTHTSPDHL